jgi:hypothetical protein
VLGVAADAGPAGLPRQWPGGEIRVISSGAQLAQDAAGADVVFLWEPGYTLALVSAIGADLPATLRFQAQRQWRHRETKLLSGSRAVILGAAELAAPSTGP